MWLAFQAVPVDHASPVPAYLQLEQDLRRQIQSGELQDGHRLPPELKLAPLYGVSRVTLRQALERLAGAGLIRRQHGSGTIVTRLPEVTLDLRLVSSVTAQLHDAGYTTQVRVLEQAIGVPPPTTARTLGLAADALGVVIRRVVEAEGSPLSYNTSWLPARLVPGLEGVDFGSSDDSLWSVLAADYGLVPAKVRNTLEIISSAAQEADILHVGFGAPLIKLTGLISDKSGQLIEHSTAYWITSRIRIHF